MPRGRLPGFSQRTPDVESARCCACERDLPPAGFRVRTVAGYRYLRSQCRECEKPVIRAAIRKWQGANRDRMNRTRNVWAHETGLARNHYIKFKYGDRGMVTAEEWIRVVTAYDGRCAYCAAPWEEMDHVLALSRGGLHEVGNIVPACKACNRRKRMMTPQEWIGPTPSDSPPLILTGQERIGPWPSA